MRSLVIFCFLIACAACADRKGEPANDSGAPHSPVDQCTVYTKAQLLEIALEKLEERDSNIWNFSDPDTMDFFSSRDYFTNTQTKDLFVVLGGVAGGSAGTDHYLTILFQCGDTAILKWAGQTAPVSDTDIKDLDNDGIKEIITQSSVLWMGESHNLYSIVNFKGGVRHELYKAHSWTLLDCGTDSMGANRQPGDTVEITYTTPLHPKQGQGYAIYQTSVCKTYNGGIIDADVERMSKKTYDTSVINLE